MQEPVFLIRQVFVKLDPAVMEVPSAMVTSDTNEAALQGTEVAVGVIGVDVAVEVDVTVGVMVTVAVDVTVGVLVTLGVSVTVGVKLCSTCCVAIAALVR